MLRFWETKFPQVRPLKRGGGRRYYRPEDVDLLRQIRSLLYHEGYTIKGVQRLMREGALKERVDALEADTIDLSQLGEAERRRREIAIGDPSAELAARPAAGPARTLTPLIARRRGGGYIERGRRVARRCVFILM